MTRLGVVAIGLIVVAQLGSVTRRWADRGGPRAIDSALVATIARHSSPDDPVLAIGDGQWIGWQIGRPTLAVPTRAFTANAWDEREIRDLVDRYRVRLVIVNRRQEQSAARSFVVDLSEHGPPAWLRPVAEVEGAKVFSVVANSR